MCVHMRVHASSPMTGLRLDHKGIMPNANLRKLCQAEARHRQLSKVHCVRVCVCV